MDALFLHFSTGDFMGDFCSCVSCTCTYVFILWTRKFQYLVRGHFCFKFPLICLSPRTSLTLLSWMVIQGGIDLSSFSFCGWPVYLLLMAVLPPTEIRFQVEFLTGDHPHDLNRLLVHLELGQVECDINTFIYPVMWPTTRGFDPPINDLSLYWVPWDEELSSTKVTHFYVADISMYNELATLAHHLNGQMGMVSHQAPRDHRDNTLLVIHQVPLIFMMEILGQLSQQARDLDRRVQDLEATVQFLRNRLGL